MTAKEPTVVFASPFKFGFFAGLGFFFASALMSIVTFVVLAVAGISLMGVIGGILHQQSLHQGPQHTTAIASNNAQ